MVRVAPKLMGESRKGERTRGKSDPIDALAVPGRRFRRAPQTLPAAHLDNARWRSSCCSITARTWSERTRTSAASLASARPLARASRSGRPPRSHHAARPDRPQALAAPSSAHESAFAATSCARSATRPGEPKSSSASSRRSSARRRRSCSSCPAAARSPPPDHRRDRRRRRFHPTPSSPGSQASRRSPPPRATANATASTAAAIASSTARSTGSRSPRAASIRRLGTTWPASRPRASRALRRCAASSATSPGASGTPSDVPLIAFLRTTPIPQTAESGST